MTYLLDTNACISYLNNSESPIRERLQALAPSSVVLCSIVEAELYYGVMNSRAPSKNLAKLTLFLSQFALLPFDSTAAREFGRIRAKLAQRVRRLGRMTFR